MTRTSIYFPFIFILLFALQSCTEPGTSREEVISNYANMVHQSYSDSYQNALAMQKTIGRFLENPTEEGLKMAKSSWLEARDIYGKTEVYRETNSPVDVEYSETNPWGIANEGQMNAWPIDESYIDYAAEGTEAYAGFYTSVIGDTTVHITPELLVDLNEKDTDKSISTGWHAIEFLLWGQDNTLPKENMPGMRQFSDYTSAPNAERRGQYLEVVTALLIADLKKLVDTWAVGGAYRTIFENLDTETALTQLVNGAFFLAGDELSSERMIAPVDSTDGVDGSGQEDEHSCFADNTHRDIYVNMVGINNVIFGTYDTISGPSFYDLVLEVDKKQANLLKQAADKAMTSVTVIADHEQPFDYLITQETSSDTHFGPIMQSVAALQELGNEISVSANILGINLR
ncbi:MAG: imelysin family protein [Bacteroidota bacterium]